MCQDLVTMRWLPTTIKALCPEPRSYQIETLEGVIYRRITKSSENPTSLTGRLKEEDNPNRISIINNQI